MELIDPEVVNAPTADQCLGADRSNTAGRGEKGATDCPDRQQFLQSVVVFPGKACYTEYGQG